MKCLRPLVASLIAAVALATALPRSAQADPVKCHKKIVQQLARYKRAVLTSQVRCLDKQNVGKLSGPCPDTLTGLKLADLNLKVAASVAKTCTMADIVALGFRSDCAYEAPPLGSGIEAQCAALPVTTPQEFTECMKCWKRAELEEFVATLYASHAVEVCGGALDDSSPVCSDLDCTTPLPDQRDLGDTAENDCQRAIGRAGINYLLKRERTLERCALAGGAESSCSADLKVQTALARAELSKEAAIKRKCGGFDPAPSLPFCCKTGPGNACAAAATRDDCTVNLGGQVQEGKTCGGGGTCQPVGGGKKVTWWGSCPESSTCPGVALSTLDDLIGCVDSSAEAIVDELMCFQFPSGWSCPTD